MGRLGKGKQKIYPRMVFGESFYDAMIAATSYS